MLISLNQWLDISAIPVIWTNHAGSLQVMSRANHTAATQNRNRQGRNERQEFA